MFAKREDADGTKIGGRPQRQARRHTRCTDWLEQFQFRLCVLCLERLKLTRSLVRLALLDDLDYHRDNAKQNNRHHDKLEVLLDRWDIAKNVA